METEDPFSSFIIHPYPKPSIEATISIQNPEDQIENPKLQTRRKNNKHVNRSSSINESHYKIIVKYGGYFKPINNGAKEKYYSGKQRTIYLDETCYSVEELFEEVSKFYLDDDTLKLSLLFLDKRVSFQSFIQVEDDTSYKLMLSMYEEEKKVIIYVNAEDSLENYVDSYFTVARLRTAYANGIATMPSKDEWLSLDLGYVVLPPILKRPAGRPRKNRIKSCDEPKRRSHKCTRCGQFGHYRKTCKNAVPSQEGEGTSHGEIKRKLKPKRVLSKGKAGPKKRACPPSIFKLIQEENI